MDYRAKLEENKENTELLNNLVSELNGWDGSLDYLEAMEFDDEFFNVYFEGKPEEAARATYFGNIENWNDEYIRFNGYGNLESLSEYQRERELLENAEDIIKAALENAENIDLDGCIDMYTEGE